MDNERLQTVETAFRKFVPVPVLDRRKPFPLSPHTRILDALNNCLSVRAWLRIDEILRLNHCQVGVDNGVRCIEQPPGQSRRCLKRILAPDLANGFHESKNLVSHHSS